jgi:hypothetical protein
MPQKTGKPKQKSGAQKLRDAGKRAVLLGITPEQHAELVAAARAECRPLCQYLLYYGLMAARRGSGNQGPPQ